MSRESRKSALVPVVAAVAALVAGVTAVLPSAEASPDRPVPRVAPLVVERAADALEGEGQGEGVGTTVALRDLVVALPTLSGADRRRAEALLARPTDGPDDPAHDGYRMKSKRDCGTNICVHWVPRTRDAPPDRDWVTTTQRVLRTTWRIEIGRLGYRRPLADFGRGGNDKLDVYLKDVGSEGLYGYCIPERARTGEKWEKPGYCVLDDDFARSQFGARPRHSLRVTAAHEFFHAVQFAYDYGEDRWLLEASATWIEERVADGINDNRQYLRYGQVRRPARPLDLFDPEGFNQYGNWAFFEYLSRRFGRDVVRRVWRHATGPDENYSTRAVARALPRGTTFRGVFRRYAVANATPGASYPEGTAWPRPQVAARHRLTRTDRRVAGSLELDHLTSRYVVLRPGDSLDGGAWTLRVAVDGPLRRTDPTAFLRVRRAGGTLRDHPIRLAADGRGVLHVRFDASTVHRAVLTLANASRRFRCWRGELTYSCQGEPRDDGRVFGYRLRISRP